MEKKSLWAFTCLYRGGTSIRASCSCKVSNLERLVKGVFRVFCGLYQVSCRLGGSWSTLRFRAVSTLAGVIVIITLLNNPLAQSPKPPSKGIEAEGLRVLGLGRALEARAYSKPEAVFDAFGSCVGLRQSEICHVCDWVSDVEAHTFAVRELTARIRASPNRQR